MCSCGIVIESRIHVVGESERYKEERDALRGDEETRQTRHGDVVH